ncbi:MULTISPECIES: F0F1 ATP synthase subunit B [unclassified Apibacter]|uniref:F0F1 ATP synthase subunit B n=1 Tax=unclassified Apibacter TaxID=2630820 RepID=UPI00132BDA8B|nr:MULTISPECIES: F0F1 ATP synthase subunit B [unclassified Apibacter]MCX8677853.1 F0F1 ATP synthase subunit B [Apibacter sp. B3919]MXO25195.1 F0F1 ATP synthase subunit B [Apibacter sp. B3924]MXO27398.1 F0F1 ATP synthase subunit B [Apibacter sp. B3813]MXO29211.1 F0F1 ATP synthase subunit B [Apibacter sp. B3913]MXO31286.1 F0F1 ATP synthase subunit B [Apibacter sp. B3912]
MDLLTPSIGLIFWMTISFIVLLIILGKYAWKPILKALENRENSIQKSLDEAKNAREEMAKLTSQNEQILKEARMEREAILKEAREIKDKIINDAKDAATAESNKIIQSAKETINAERISAINQIKSEVADLSVDIAKKVLQKELSSPEEQKKLIDSLVNQAKLN